MKISIAIPYYSGMRDAEAFLKRCLDSIERQSFKDYEVVVSEEGVVGRNINEAVKRCKGEIVQVMCMDDWFAHDNALKDIAAAFEGEWLISGCSNNPNPYYTGDIHQGNNKLGGLSAIAFKREGFIGFDPSLVWLIDCDFYRRMYDLWGSPKILNGVHVMIGEGEHQTTNTLMGELKRAEVAAMTQRYA